MNKLKIEMPPELRQRALNAIASAEKAKTAADEHRAEFGKKISTLEATATELAGRITTLSILAVQDEQSATELIRCERRCSLIQPEIDRLKKVRDGQSAVNTEEIESVHSDVLLHWELSIDKAAKEACEIFGVAPSIRPIVLANLHPMLAITMIRNNYRPSLAIIIRTLRSALAGNFDLRDPVPDSSVLAVESSTADSAALPDVEPLTFNNPT